MIASDPFFDYQNFMLTFSLDEANQVNKVMNGDIENISSIRDSPKVNSIVNYEQEKLSCVKKENTDMNSNENTKIKHQTQSTKKVKEE